MDTISRFYLLLPVLSLVRCDNPVPDQDQTPALNPEEMYQDIFPLTREKFTEIVLRNKDPWIVIFHDGSMDRAWKTMATHLRGLCWIGIVDTRHSELLLKETVRFFFFFFFFFFHYNCISLSLKYRRLNLNCRFYEVLKSQTKINSYFTIYDSGDLQWMLMYLNLNYIYQIDVVSAKIREEA